MGADNGKTLAEQARALLALAERETQQAEEERGRLMEECATKLAAIREEYASKIAAIDGDIKMAERVRRAIDPPARKPYTAKAQGGGGGGGRKQNLHAQVSAAKVNRVLLGVEEGNHTQAMLAEYTEVHRASVGNAIAVLRDDGLVRLTGKEPGKGGRTLYALTPRGRERAAELRADAANGVAVDA